MTKKLDDKDLKPVSGGVDIDAKTPPKGGPRPTAPLQGQDTDDSGDVQQR